RPAQDVSTREHLAGGYYAGSGLAAGERSEPRGDLDPRALEGGELPADAGDTAGGGAALADEEPHPVEELRDVPGGPALARAGGAPREPAVDVGAEVALRPRGLGEGRGAQGLALLLGQVLEAEDGRQVRRPLEGGVVLALVPGLGEAHRLP